MRKILKRKLRRYHAKQIRRFEDDFPDPSAIADVDSYDELCCGIKESN